MVSNCCGKTSLLLIQEKTEVRLFFVEKNKIENINDLRLSYI